MENKKMKILWYTSLLVISVGTLVLSVTNIFALEVPDVIQRIIGVCDLIALPILIYSTIKVISKNIK